MDSDERQKRLLQAWGIQPALKHAVEASSPTFLTSSPLNFSP